MIKTRVWLVAILKDHKQQQRQIGQTITQEQRGQNHQNTYYEKARKFYTGKNNNKVGSIETGSTVIADLFP